MENGRAPVFVLGSGITSVGVLRSLGRAGIKSYCVGGSRDPLVRHSRWYRAAPDTDGEQPQPQDLSRYLERVRIPNAVLIPCADDWVKAVAELPDAIRTRFPAD